jgi:hypothetical protein
MMTIILTLSSLPSLSSFLLMLAGQVAIHAVGIGDDHLLRLVGGYLLAVSAIGLVALPRSPFIAGAVISALVLAAGYRLI